MNQALVNLFQNILNFILRNFLPHQHVPVVKSLVQKKEATLSQPHLPSEEKLSIPQKSVFNLSSIATRDQSNVNLSYSHNLRSYAKKDPISSPSSQEFDDTGTAVSSFSLSINSDLSTAVCPEVVAHAKFKKTKKLTKPSSNINNNENISRCSN
jgi:hypothetical protein